ncbi:hypothetical protein [Aporhodopirellula aestuarii]|uniref:Uncharacterized protein n=1 Tax=Aporhodopirellula aestuarii TaxID=2950107 RepID=A0ABT0TXT2_9BACT|nr:hypothetical protein [Aporhodopirellula aestuarii]MCM2369380.1 hypothetical protein [Aporhodopirellula aestuarii]
MAVTLFRKPTIWIFLLMVGFTSTASADFGTWLHNKKMAFYRNAAWPDPFNEVDALQTVAPFEVMKTNGWRLHNTIGHELFRAGDGALLAAGHNRVRWIATQAPLARREIYVLEGANPNETGARVAAVRDAVAGLAVDGVSPQILVTHSVPATTPGSMATKINRDRFENIPVPKLPTTTASGQQGAAE